MWVQYLYRGHDGGEVPRTPNAREYRIPRAVIFLAVTFFFFFFFVGPFVMYCKKKIVN